MLDVLRKNTSSIIGNRSFSTNSNIIKILGKICVKEYNLNKVATVIKHIPGHGCALVDSHLKLPKVSLNYNELEKNDFAVFKSTNSFFAMTAHVLYKCIDQKNPATFFPKK